MQAEPPPFSAKSSDHLTFTYKDVKRTVLGTTVGSLRNQETSCSESPCWVEAFADWKGLHRVQEPTGFFPWNYGLHNLNSTTFLLSCKTHLKISKDTREYNIFCAWEPPLLDRKVALFTFYQSILSDSAE